MITHATSKLPQIFVFPIPRRGERGMFKTRGRNKHIPCIMITNVANQGGSIYHPREEKRRGGGSNCTPPPRMSPQKWCYATARKGYSLPGPTVVRRTTSTHPLCVLQTTLLFFFVYFLFLPFFFPFYFSFSFFFFPIRFSFFFLSRRHNLELRRINRAWNASLPLRRAEEEVTRCGFDEMRYRMI